MIKKIIYVVAVVVVFGGLAVAAIQTHKSTVNKQTAQTTSLQSKVTAANTKLDTLVSQFDQFKTSSTTQFNADKTALCTYIEQHVNTKTVALPSECTSNSL